MCTQIIVTLPSFNYRLFVSENFYTQDFTQICFISSNLRLRFLHTGLHTDLYDILQFETEAEFLMIISTLADDIFTSQPLLSKKQATTNRNCWNIEKITLRFGDHDIFNRFHLISGKQFGRGGAGVGEGGSFKCQRASCLCQQVADQCLLGNKHPYPNPYLSCRVSFTLDHLFNQTR